MISKFAQMGALQFWPDTMVANCNFMLYNTLVFKSIKFQLFTIVLAKWLRWSDFLKAWIGKLAQQEQFLKAWIGKKAQMERFQSFSLHNF